MSHRLHFYCFGFLFVLVACGEREADEPSFAAGDDVAYITAGIITLRSGPSNQAEKIDDLIIGTEVAKEDTQATWIAVRTISGNRGWIQSQHLGTKQDLPEARAALARGGARKQPKESVAAETEQPTSKPEVSVDSRQPVTDYFVNGKAEILGRNRLRIDVTTNIPGTVEMMAGVSLSGQKPDDLFVGMDQRTEVRDGRGQAVLDVSGLPKGAYDVEVTFYPRWGFRSEKSRRAGITEPIESVSQIHLTGSGESADEVLRRKEGQKWVMESIIQGSPWRPTEWRRRFGISQEVPIDTDRFNPRIIKAYYFKAVDMTVFVNILKNEVSHWRTGKARS